MRQSTAPASSSTTHIGGDDAGVDAQLLPHSPALAASSQPGTEPHAATPFMSQHGQPNWPASASEPGSAELIDAMHDASDDQDMADIDVEEGGVPLVGPYANDSHDISPFIGSTILAAPSYDASDIDDSISLDVEYEMPPIAPLQPATEPGLPSPLSPDVLVPVGQAFSQLPAFAQQVLSSIPAHQVPQMAQAQVYAQMQAQLLANQQQILGQQQQQLQFLNDPEDEFGDAHGALSVSPQPVALGPDNFSVADFLRSWALLGRSCHGQPVPCMDQINSLIRNKNTPRIEYDDLHGDACDFQGIDWMGLDVPRSRARERRRVTYKNYVNRVGSDKFHVSCTCVGIHACLC